MFSILSERDVPAFLSRASLNDKACISIGDPGGSMPRGMEAAAPCLLRLEFFDLGESDPERGRERIPEISDVKACIDFFRKNAHRDFVIQSDLGLGRAPAVALGLIYLKTGKEETAKNEVVSLCPRAMPNKRLVLLFDRVLGTDLRSANYLIWMKRLESMRKTIGSMPSSPA